MTLQSERAKIVRKIRVLENKAEKTNSDIDNLVLTNSRGKLSGFNLGVSLALKDVIDLIYEFADDDADKFRKRLILEINKLHSPQEQEKNKHA